MKFGPTGPCNMHAGQVGPIGFTLFTVRPHAQLQLGPVTVGGTSPRPLGRRFTGGRTRRTTDAARPLAVAGGRHRKSSERRGPSPSCPAGRAPAAGWGHASMHAGGGGGMGDDQTSDKEQRLVSDHRVVVVARLKGRPAGKGQSDKLGPAHRLPVARPGPRTPAGYNRYHLLVRYDPLPRLPFL